jgi:hypothetical protein
MIHQTILPFKLEVTRDLLTSQSGLSLLGEFIEGLGLLDQIDKELPFPGSNVGYQCSEYIYPLLLMLNGGGRSIEDLREIREDSGLRELLRLSRIPSSDAYGGWLRRQGNNGGLRDLLGIERYLLCEGMKREESFEYTLDIDATGIEAEKISAKWTYKGYMPMVGHIAENGLIVGDEFREGNESPGARNLEFIKHCISQMPEGKAIKYLRSDSAGYQADIINFCESNGIKYAIGADLDSSVLKAIGNIPSGDWKAYGNDEGIAEVVHCMNKTERSFRIIVVKRPYQMDMFKETDAPIKYKVIATNREEGPEYVLNWYNKRGHYSENKIKELKIGFGMERMPCGQFEANAVFFRIGVLAYNLFKLFVLHTLDKSWHKHQVQTVRWRLYQIAGKIVFHSNQIFLKIRRGFCNLFKDIRLRIWEFVHT